MIIAVCLQTRFHSRISALWPQPPFKLALSTVMAGLVPATHVTASRCRAHLRNQIGFAWDGRDKPVHDADRFIGLGTRLGRAAGATRQDTAKKHFAPSLRPAGSLVAGAFPAHETSAGTLPAMVT